MYRSLGDHRAILSIFLLVLLILFGFGLFRIEFKDQNALRQINIAILVLVFFYHSNRPDLKMLSALCGKKNSKKILSAEYLVWTLPFVGIMCLRGFYYSLALLIIPILFPFLKQKIGRLGIKFSPFGKGNFEWNSGFRITGIFQIILFVLFITSCWVKINFGVSVLLMAILLFIFSGNYFTHESSQFVIQYRSAEEMLKAKMFFCIKYTTLIGVILAIILGLFYMKYSWIFLMIIVQINVIAITMMLLKYVYYPNKLASEANQTILWIIGVIPFLTPILILLNFHFYKKATNKLQKFYSL